MTIAQWSVYYALLEGCMKSGAGQRICLNQQQTKPS